MLLYMCIQGVILSILLNVVASILNQQVLQVNPPCEHRVEALRDGCEENCTNSSCCFF